MNNIVRTAISPPILAARWGIKPEKVIAWIRSGELRAFNAARRRGGRPRYLIFEADIEDFTRRRAIVSSAQTSRPPRRIRKNINQHIIEFF